MAEVMAGFPNGHNFGMGGRVVVVGDFVVSPANDLAVFNYNGPERPALLVPHALKGKADGLLHVFFMLVHIENFEGQK
jgi:hypothetical protein